MNFQEYWTKCVKPHIMGGLNEPLILVWSEAAFRAGMHHMKEIAVGSGAAFTNHDSKDYEQYVIPKRTYRFVDDLVDGEDGWHKGECPYSPTGWAWHHDGSCTCIKCVPSEIEGVQP